MGAMLRPHLGRQLGAVASVVEAGPAFAELALDAMQSAPGPWEHGAPGVIMSPLLTARELLTLREQHWWAATSGFDRPTATNATAVVHVQHFAAALPTAHSCPAPPPCAQSTMPDWPSGTWRQVAAVFATACLMHCSGVLPSTFHVSSLLARIACPCSGAPVPPHS